MRIPHPRLISGLMVGGLVLFGLWITRSPGPPRRIILIVVDTLRRDALSCYGGSVPTPHIDALAKRGQRISHELASFHQTTMSMGALFTGKNPSLETGQDRATVGWNGRTWCGLSRFAQDAREKGCIPHAIATLGERMRQAGYTTLAVVTNPLLFRPAGFSRGFDRWIELSDRTAPSIRTRSGMTVHRSSPASKVHSWVRKLLDTRKTDRFFLYLHYMDVHDYRLWHKPYAVMVAEIDEAIGNLVDLLQDRNLLDGTVVILTGDHGERLGETHWTRGRRGHRGNPSFEEVLEIPLIVWPARFPNPRASMRSQDLFDSLLRLAGLRLEPKPALLRKDELFLSEMHWQTYRQGRWKSFRNRKDGTFSLIDLENDPEERTDVASRFPAVVRKHTERVEQLVRALGAPSTPKQRLSPEDRQRLEALGYLEP